MAGAAVGFLSAKAMNGIYRKVSRKFVFLPQAGLHGGSVDARIPVLVNRSSASSAIKQLFIHSVVYMYMRRIHRLKSVQRIPASLGGDMGFFSNPGNLSAITPPFLNLKVTQEADCGTGI